MAQRTINNPWVAGAQTLGEALFPNQRAQVAGRMAGQQLSKMAADTDLARAKADGEQDQNDALTDAVLRSAGFDDKTIALIRAGRGNAEQLAGAYQTVGQVGADAAAGDAYQQGDYDAAGAARLRGGRDPLKTNDIQGGYQLNPYDTGGGITPTGETLADIAATAALSRQRDAAAGYDRERTANPDRFRAPPRAAAAPKPVTISPAESKAIADEAARFLPGAAGTQENVMALTGRASELIVSGAPPAQALQQAFSELFETVPTRTTGDNDWIPFNEETIPGGVQRRVNIVDPTQPSSMAASPRAPAGAAPSSGPTAGNAAEQIRAAYKAGRMSRDQAVAELRKLGFN